MKTTIDVRGLSCPEPLLKLKQALEKQGDGGVAFSSQDKKSNTPVPLLQIELLTESQSVVDNCTRFAESKGFSVATVGENGEYTMTIKKR